jgi:hypothetical protein
VRRKKTSGSEAPTLWAIFYAWRPPIWIGAAFEGQQVVRASVETKTIGETVVVDATTATDRCARVAWYNLRLSHSPIGEVTCGRENGSRKSEGKQKDKHFV